MENGKKYLEQTIAHLARFIADHPHSPEIVSAAKAMAELHGALTAETLGDAMRQLTDNICKTAATHEVPESAGLGLLSQVGEMLGRGGE